MRPRGIRCVCSGALRLLICVVSVFSAVTFAQTSRATNSQWKVDYSRFSHLSEQHRVACSSCHTFPSKNWKQVRKSDDAFPDVTEYPEHQACLGCHRQQFFVRQRPAPRICSNCHVKATPVDTTRYPFPSLGQAFLATAKGRDFVSDFRVAFPHDKHADATCTDCHQIHQPQGKSDDEFVTKPPKDLGDAYWLKKGTFQTRPLTHSGCFTCHNQESELAPLPQNCDSCHKPAGSDNRATDFTQDLVRRMTVEDWWMRTAWRKRISAGAFRHEVHPDLNCTQCHEAVTKGMAKQVVPVKSCGGAEGCHITATTDDGGVLNYEIDQRNKDSKFVCAKCHLAFGTKPVPASHLSAIPKPAK